MVEYENVICDRCGKLTPEFLTKRYCRLCDPTARINMRNRLIQRMRKKILQQDAQIKLLKDEVGYVNKETRS